MENRMLKICGINNGFCRVDYVAENEDGQMVYYCIQEEYKDVFVFYRTTPDWHEPQYEVKCVKSIWEVPTGDSTIEKNVRKFLES